MELKLELKIDTFFVKTRVHRKYAKDTPTGSSIQILVTTFKQQKEKVQNPDNQVQTKVYVVTQKLRSSRKKSLGMFALKIFLKISEIF